MGCTEERQEEHGKRGVGLLCSTDLYLGFDFFDRGHLFRTLHAYMHVNSRGSRNKLRPLEIEGTALRTKACISITAVVGEECTRVS